MVLFEDVFYPDNPKRRKQVRDYVSKIHVVFTQFKDSWNDMVNVFNKAVEEKHPEWKLENVDYDPNDNDVKKISESIKKVIDETQKKMKKIHDDVGLEDVHIEALKNPSDIEGVLKALNAVTFVVDSLVAGAIVIFSIYMFATMEIVLEVVSVMVASIIGGIVGAFIAFGGFVISDMIVSAITGAIERKELNEAIEILSKYDEEVITPLSEVSNKLAGLTINMKDGTYDLGNGYIIYKGKLKKMD